MAAPPAADDDEWRVGERDDGGEHSADGAPRAWRRSPRRSPAPPTGQEPVDVDRGRPGRRRPSSPNTSMNGIARPCGPTVTRCAISPARPACPRPTSPSLTTRIPDPRRGRGRRSRPGRVPALSRSARAAQLTSLSTITGPSTSGASTSTGSSSPTRNGASGRWTSRPVRAVHRVGGADHRQPERSVRRRAAPRRPRSAARRRPASGRAGRSIVRVRARHGVAVGVDALGHDALGRDADHQRDADVGGQGVVRADPAPPRPPGVRSPVSTSRPASVSRRTLSPDGRLGEAGLGGQLGPGQPPVPHQRAQHVLVGQRAQQLQRRLGGIHAPILVRSSCLEGCDAPTVFPSKES